jgi:hypothetical protein
VTGASARRRRVLFLYNVPDWAIHNIGRDWAGLLADTHDVTLMPFGRHEHERAEDYNHVVWGYSILGYSGRTLLASLLERPLGWWRWRRGTPRACAVIQDPGELFPAAPDWAARTPDTSHLKAFHRLAVTSNEMLQVTRRLGLAAVKVNTRSLLPLREVADIRPEGLRLFTRARDYPRKNLALFAALRARSRDRVERCEAVVGDAVLPQAEYLRLIDGFNVYVCTSWQEGGPLPLMDAQRRGCVVLTTRVGQTDELVEDGVNGFFCDDEAAFVRRITELSEDPARFAAMRRQALERAARDTGPRIRDQLQAFLP